jgi:hypothetical protein
MADEDDEYEGSVKLLEVLDAIRSGERKIMINDYEFEYEAGVELEALDTAVAAGGAGITHFGMTETIVDNAAEIFDAVGDTLARCTGLRTLVLRGILGEQNHEAGDEGTPALVRAVTKILREHPMLTELDLVDNDLDLPTVSAMLAGGVGALKRLRLGFNALGLNYTHPGTPPDASVLFQIRTLHSARAPAHRARSSAPAMSQDHHTIVHGVTESRAQPPLRPARRGEPSGGSRNADTQRPYTATQAPAHTRTRTSMRAPSDQPHTLVLDKAGGEAAGTGTRPGAGAHTTNANRRHRHVRRPNTRCVIGCRGQ